MPPIRQVERFLASDFAVEDLPQSGRIVLVGIVGGKWRLALLDRHDRNRRSFVDVDPTELRFFDGDGAEGSYEQLVRAPLAYTLSKTVQPLFKEYDWVRLVVDRLKYTAVGFTKGMVGNISNVYFSCLCHEYEILFSPKDSFGDLMVYVDEDDLELA